MTDEELDGLQTEVAELRARLEALERGLRVLGLAEGAEPSEGA